MTSALRKRAEQAAWKVFNEYCERASTGDYDDAMFLADAIEAEARRFAERALRCHFDAAWPNLPESGKVARMQAQSIAEAIAAAEREQE